jgi:hypothetical protein
MIIEALKLSKETGRSFVRRGSKWVQWDSNWTYQFTGEELLADDWEDVETYIPKLTGGRWSAADYPPNSVQEGK